MNKIIPIQNVNRFSGSALKKARLLRGLSMEELSEKISVSQQMISKYENGKSIPTADILTELSNILNFPPIYFYSEQKISDINDGFYRKSSNVPKKNKYRVVEKVSFFSSILNEIMKVVKLPTYKDPVVINRTDDFKEISYKYIEKISNLIRKKYGFGNGPLLNLTGFLESMGIFIIFTDLESEKIDAYTVFLDKKKPIIIINSQRISSSRIRFNLAHEFAHILFHREYKKKYENGTKYTRIEQEANYFAGCFLVPENGLIEDMSSITLQHFIILKSHWHVSIAALIYRANQCGFISDNHTLHLRQQISRNKWRNLEPLDDKIEIEYPVLINQALNLYSNFVQNDALEVLGNKLKLFPSFINELLFDKKEDENKISKLNFRLI